MFSRLRRLPGLGAFFSWVGNKLVPRDAKFWLQVSAGPAQGLWLKVHPRADPYVKGTFEPGVQQALVDRLRPGMVFYDIGANIGFFTLLAARLVGPHGKVFAFEPEPEVAARLKEHVERNQFTNIMLEEVAVWSETGTVSFLRSNPHASPDRGFGHVELAAEARNSIQVPAISLDTCSRHTPPDFLKCDVEGAEAHVFGGALNVLKQTRPLVICELHGEDNGRIIGELLDRLGYSCHPCGDNHVLALPL